MTLLLIARKVWAYKLATLPILVLMLIGAIYVVAVKKPVYTTSATYVLVNPPAPPSPEEIARNPKAGAGANNPYTRFSDQSIVGQIVTARLSSQEARQRLEQQGADPRYTVAPDVSFGFTAPILKITGTGGSPQSAITTANVVGSQITRLLADMQQAHGVAPRYQITSQLLVGAREATLKASGTLRGLVAILALGGVLLFLVVSVLDAVAILRRRDAEDEAAADDHVDARAPARPAEQVARTEPSVARQTSEGPPARELWQPSN